MTLLRRPGAAVATLLIFLMGAAFLTQVVPYRQIVDANRQVTEARDRLATLQTENETLQAEADALQTDSAIEKLAREKLGYVRPGEIAYVVLDPPGTVDEEVETVVEPVPPEEATWVDRVWDFLTGADLGD
jgi:cell division protein FtsL